MITRVRLGILCLVAAGFSAFAGYSVAQTTDPADGDIVYESSSPGEDTVYGYEQISKSLAEQARDIAAEGGGSPITNDEIADCESTPDKGLCDLVLAGGQEK